MTAQLVHNILETFNKYAKENKIVNYYNNHYLLEHWKSILSIIHREIILR
jgi:hypothetical protein